MTSLFYRCGYAEVLTRRIFAHFPKWKEKIKAKRKDRNIRGKQPFDSAGWEEYKKIINHCIDDNSILLVHASMDGLNDLGVEENRVFDFLTSFLNRGCTIVTTAFPITNLKIKGNRMKLYDPETTPCWSGMLSNRFVASPLTIRSAVPFNSLAAMGPLAEDMMRDNLKATSVYGEHTPWKYCVDHHARILFIGTTSLESNTIQAHMLADYMGARWPIDHWYDEYETPIKIDGEVMEHTLKIQNPFWSRYVVEYATTRKIKEKGLLKKYTISCCPFEYVTDGYELVKYLESECEKGRLMYLIPKKHWKKERKI